MEEKSLIKQQSLLLKIKGKIIALIKKFSKKPKETNEKVIEKQTKSKSEIFKLYNDAKLNKIDLSALSEEEIKMLTSLCKEEISIIKRKLENEIVEINMSKRKIKYYQEKLKNKE